VILNDGGKIPECFSDSTKHKWVVTRRPDGNRSGWHEETCSLCGKVISYDDSD
jgi:hypothetical protein